VSAQAHPFSAEALRRDHMRRRRIVNRVMEALSILAAALAVGVLVIMVASVVERGLPALNKDFFTATPHPFSFTNEPSGIANAIVGSIILVFVATLMALPFGILAAIYLTEFAGPRARNAITLLLDVLNGVPAVVIGIFVFTLIVFGHGQSGFAGSFALAILMLPMIARATQEVLLLVPHTQREAALALGATKARTTMRVVLPMAVGGIVTGATLAVADPADHARAWAAALVLILFVLLTGIAARSLAARNRKRMYGRGHH
jgi:phosphate transport system permease protein